MKKFIVFLSLFIITLFIPYIVNAAEVNYKNVITDGTSIQEDFEVLGMDINEYYEPTKYDYDKWYVVAMSESYDENYNIQTYFYLYNPVKYDSITRNKMSSFDLKYKFGENGSIKSSTTTKLMYDEEHLLYKIKGFKYEFIEKQEIYITEISYVMVTSGTRYSSTSTFNSINNHSKINGLSTELSFDTMLILEEYKVVPVKVSQDMNFINWFNKYWNFEPTSMYVYFYNFNFPDHIKYDDVIYAKFEYDKVNYSGVDVFDSMMDEFSNYHTIKENKRKTIIEEYNVESKTLQVNDKSMELTFPTFYLGNRVNDKQFGELEMNSYSNLFEYDCSILLGSTYEYSQPFSVQLMGSGITIGESKEYDQLEEIEILELHYKNNGVVYNCQVAGDNLSPGDPGYEEPVIPKKTKKDRIKELIEFILRILGFLILVIMLSFFSPIFSVIFKAIWYVLTLPFKLIAKLFKRRKN